MTRIYAVHSPTMGWFSHRQHKTASHPEHDEWSHDLFYAQRFRVKADAQKVARRTKGRVYELVPTPTWITRPRSPISLPLEAVS